MAREVRAFESDNAEQYSTGCHVVVCVFPSQGHIIPALSFSKILASKGITVTYACAEHRIAELMRRMHAATATAEEEDYICNIRLAALPDRLPLGQYGIDEGVESMSWVMENVSMMKADFQELMKDLVLANSHHPAATCIISDFFLSWSQDVANLFNIPRYVFFPSPAACLCIFMYLPVLIAQGQIPVRTLAGNCIQGIVQPFHGAENIDTVIIVPGLPPVSKLDMPNSLRDICPKDRQEFAINSLLRMHESAGIFVNSFYELEGTAIDALQSESTINPNKVPILPIGPLLPFDHEHFSAKKDLKNIKSAEERRCVEWLDQRPISSVLYVSFGSVTIFSVAQIQEFAFGLEESGQYFVWVVRPPTSVHSDASGIQSLLPQGFGSRTRDRGLIVCKWAPQLLILSHPSVGGFLTHCGWNSTLESIYHGIPMLAFPQFAEQHLNCRMVVEQLKIGVELARNAANGIAKRGEIERSVKLLMASDEGRLLRKTAREVRERARRAGAAAYKAIRNML